MIRGYHLIILICLVGCQGEVQQKLSPHVDSNKPHFMIIMADDVGMECFDLYGTSEYSTPNISKLGEEGKVFEYAFSQPLCTPSRMEMLTGQSNLFNYVYFELLPKKEKTFAHYLSDHGYKTCVGGKWQLTGIDIPDTLKGQGQTPEQAGFQESYVYELESKPKRYWGATYHFNGKEVTFDDDEFGPDFIVDELEGFMSKNYDSPMLIYYPMIMSHSPFVKTPSFNPDGRIPRKDRYKAMIEHMDHLVGRLVRKTEELGIRENTFILFTTDNGTSSKFESDFNGTLRRGGKGTTTDPGIHAPFVVSWKGNYNSGRVVNTCVGLYDIYPTIAEIISDSILPAPHGKSFLDHLQEDAGAAKNIHFGYFHPTRVIPRDSQTAVIFAQDQNWKLYQDGRFFNKAEDPEEQNSIKKEDLSPNLLKVHAILDSIIEQAIADGPSHEIN